ncbi:peroxisomal targeting signal receptor [Saccharata proteae CBS 121410]|uniref:Peroxisomal targeting signal receptor n=1 Tax=Saccharata proteae CBS 121410 TaxID=1314787 RepID=A0A9P4HXX1_9PEZI|nr:peroxisomal targeting signal receptor [Saccharata proteae CBS 121410]
MSFLGGAECSTAGNPLSQFTKHVQDDKSLQRDRLVGRGPGGMQEGMRNQALGGPQEQMLNDFMHESNQLPQNAIPASPFAMDQMRRDLEQASHIQRNGSPGWAAEFDPGMEAAHVNPAFQHQQPASFSTAEFNNFQHLGPTAVSGEASPMGYQRPMGYGMGRSGLGMGMGMGGMGMGMRPFQSTDVQRPVSELKGKGRMVELDEKDWEAEFAQLESAGQQNLDALDAEANAAMERELNGIDRSVLSETNEFGDFESIWRGIQAETANARALVDEENFAHMGDLDQWDSFDGNNTLPSLRVPQMGDYLFEESNPFKEVTDPFSEGLAILQNGGNLSLAALAFEAAVQKDPQHVEAWTKLGAAQAQNEKESPAIRALEQALKIDPSNLEALMGLAVSYTNEGYDSTAYRTLERWIATKYPSLIGVEGLSSPADVGFTDRNMLHEKVTDLFIRAAQMSPSGEQMDPDVQVGLGVLFYGAEEYDKAVDCFGAALESTEDGTTNQQDQVHLLWNRLGATLANSGRSEEAIDAYENALAQRPNFVRARYNLGVSCINIGCFEEAAQHLLGALAMHKVVEREGREKAREVVGDGVSDGELERMISQNQSTNLYDTLRRVFSQMDRRDLGDMVGPGMDVDKFREWFEF